MPVTVPDRSPSSLGPALSNTRAPTTNELSAVHVEEIKDLLIEFAEGINTPDLEVGTYADTAITVTGLDGVFGPLKIRPYGLSGETALVILPDTASTGPGKAVTVTAGQGALDEDGGTLSLDAGLPNGTGDGGNIRIGRENADAIFSGKEGSGSTWTHEGDLAVSGDITMGGVSLSDPLAPINETTTARTLVASDHGRTIRCTHADGCVITVPTDSLPLGFTCLVVQMTSGGTPGTVALAGSGAGTLQVNPDFTYTLAGIYSVASVVVVDATNVILSGDLDPA